jgi:16S rRNA A1518/A1519 N6-dimethyltransferase RsmA/KsgA/DIM1 with predicted DNA glycosylase/AP lyase activity
MRPRFREIVEFPPEVLRALQTVVRAGFAHRRKTLRNALVPFFSGGTDQWCEMLEVEGIDPKGRAEEVTPASWLSLARLLLLPPFGGC